jgi:hypothetical protein
MPHSASWALVQPPRLVIAASMSRAHGNVFTPLLLLGWERLGHIDPPGRGGSMVSLQKDFTLRFRRSANYCWAQRGNPPDAWQYPSGCPETRLAGGRSLRSRCTGGTAPGLLPSSPRLTNWSVGRAEPSLTHFSASEASAASLSSPRFLLGAAIRFVFAATAGGSSYSLTSAAFRTSNPVG